MATWISKYGRKRVKINFGTTKEMNGILILRRTLKKLSTRIAAHRQTSKPVPAFRYFNFASETMNSYLFQLQQHFSSNMLTYDGLQVVHFLSIRGSEFKAIPEKLFGTENITQPVFKGLTEK